MSRGTNKKNSSSISAWKNKKNEKTIAYELAKKNPGIWTMLANYIIQRQIGMFQ